MGAVEAGERLLASLRYVVAGVSAELLELEAHSAAQLGGGLLGKGDQDEGEDRYAALQQQMKRAIDQQRRFAGAGAGLNAHRAANGGDGQIALCLIGRGVGDGGHDWST